MKIGKLVQHYAADIFAYCDRNPGELDNLMDWEYSNRVFGLMFPFCAENDALTAEESVRYWKVPKPGFAAYFFACGKTRLRVTSQWFASYKGQFTDYLLDKRIISSIEEAENLPSHDYVSAVPDIGEYPNTESAAQMDGEVQNVLNRIKRDIAWLENRLTTSPKSSGGNYGGDDAKDFTQYSFNGKGPYGKGRLVLAVIRHWIKENKPANVNVLSAAFPQKLTGVGGNSGLLMSLQKAQMLYRQTGHPRHIMTRNMFDTVITGDNKEYAVSSQWKVLNIRYFINHARKWGYEIKPIASNY